MTAVETEKLPLSVSVPARGAAEAWLNAFMAASTEEDRPMLYRTLSLEWFEGGLQMIGCDGTAVFRTWTPRELTPDEYELARDFADEQKRLDKLREWPTLDEAPLGAVVVMDPDGFAKGFMSALLRVTSDEDHANETLMLSTAPMDDEATLALGAQFASERLTLRACGQRIDLRLYEGAYPNWRKVRLGIEDIERVDGMTIASRIFSLVGKLKGTTAVDLEFYGNARHVAFTARGASEVRGLLMPMRRVKVEE